MLAALDILVWIYCIPLRMLAKLLKGRNMAKTLADIELVMATTEDALAAAKKDVTDAATRAAASPVAPDVTTLFDRIGALGAVAGDISIAAKAIDPPTA